MTNFEHKIKLKKVLQRARLNSWKVNFLLLTLASIILGLDLFYSTPPQEAVGRTQPSFIEVSTKAGVTNSLEDAGASWSDYDMDGYQDLIFPDKIGHGYQLFHNNHNGTFTDVSRISGLDSALSYTGGGAAFGDYDNDGCPDLYIGMLGVQTKDGKPKPPRESDHLYHNNCDGTFTDVSLKAGIGGSYHSVGVSWVDYNNDGLLDIFVASWGAGRFDLFLDISIEPDVLYRNNGNGTFTNVSQQAGLWGLVKCKTIDPFIPKPKGFPKPLIDYTPKKVKPHWQPIWFDFNNDGNMDLYIGNDAGVGPLYKNNGDGTFTDVTEKAGLCRNGSGMGVTAGDYDNDGFIDLYVTHTERNMLWHNNQNETFSEVSEDSGVANFGSLGWGTEFLDYDNDGNLDLYVVDGSTNQKFIMGRISNTADRLYKGNGQGGFIDVTAKEGLFGNDPKVGAAVADFNNDGFPDVFVTSNRTDRKRGGLASNRLYQNTPNGNHWLTIQLIGTKSNRDGVGARIMATTPGKTQTRQILAGSSFLSQSSLWPTIGLGKTEIIDQIEVIWPSGVKQILKNIKSDQKIVITESK